MKHIKESALPCIDRWTLDSIDNMHELFEDLILKSAAEALKLALSYGEAYHVFPSLFDEKNEIDDPLTIHFSIPLAPSDDEEGPMYEFNLRDCLLVALDDCESHGEYRLELQKLSAALKKFAEEIDSTINAFKAPQSSA